MIKNPCYSCEQNGTDACTRDNCTEWQAFLDAVATLYEEGVIIRE